MTPPSPTSNRGTRGTSTGAWAPKGWNGYATGSGRPGAS